MALKLPIENSYNKEAEEAIKKVKVKTRPITFLIPIDLKEKADDFCYEKSKETGVKLTFTQVIIKSLEEYLS
ncbi:MAG: hypothetical protein LBD61_02480 [Endomicrobium sp.]|jgi:hypothetical protein|nr:hypothetical protein [Endomicrobium sp.]